ncbi:hypothetical protein OESDEN_09437 [Oesophagostomum dentatum]|uniref:Uncharacterized protein n=1 Tax=Oesophagostomum dentatum TaxID=61180 RepID=A0A0B1T4K6_OESDE|nr:hypothetical protein OESDEN_09437 [Oesophagostomum dentatum]
MLLSGIETFDSFLKFPAIRVNTEEEFVIEPSEDMKRLYEDFQVNVLGEGVDMNFAELKKRVQDRVRIQKEKIAEAERLRAKLEDEDVLGTEPFLDAIAYRNYNPKDSKTEVSRGEDPLQSKIRRAGTEFKTRLPTKFLVGGDRYETLKLERIIEEKIEKVKNRMKGVRSGEQPTFAETEQTGPSPCSSNGSEKNNSNALEKDGSFDHDSSLNLVDDDILCIYDSSNSWLSP